MTSTYKGYLEYAQKLIDGSNSIVPDEALHQICGYGMLNSTYGITRLTDKKFLASDEDKDDSSIRDDFLTQVCIDMDPDKSSNFFTKNLFDLRESDDFSHYSGAITLVSAIFCTSLGLLISVDEGPYERCMLFVAASICCIYLLCLLLLYAVDHLFELKNNNYYIFKNNCKKWNWKELIEEGRLPVYTFFRTVDKEECKKYKESMYYVIDKGALRNVGFNISKLISDDELGDIEFCKDI